MPMWNLSDYSELETSVVQPYAQRPKIKYRALPLHLPTRFKVVLSVAALAANFSIGIVQANASTIRLPISSMSVAQSIPTERPPLAHLFEDRFDAEWSEQLENNLLTQVESRRLSRTSTNLLEQTIDVVFSNQLESLSDEISGKLNRDQIANLVRSRKLQR